MKKWALKTGVLASILGAIGIVACCIPLVGAFFAAIGISVLFLHKVSIYFVLLGLVLIVLGIYLGTRRNKECKK